MPENRLVINIYKYIYSFNRDWYWESKFIKQNAVLVIIDDQLLIDNRSKAAYISKAKEKKNSRNWQRKMV